MIECVEQIAGTRSGIGSGIGFNSIGLDWIGLNSSSFGEWGLELGAPVLRMSGASEVLPPPAGLFVCPAATNGARLADWLALAADESANPRAGGGRLLDRSIFVVAGGQTNQKN